MLPLDYTTNDRCSCSLPAAISWILRISVGVAVGSWQLPMYVLYIVSWLGDNGDHLTFQEPSKLFFIIRDICIDGGETTDRSETIGQYVACEGFIPSMIILAELWLEIAENKDDLQCYT